MGTLSGRASPRTASWNATVRFITGNVQLHAKMTLYCRAANGCRGRDRLCARLPLPLCRHCGAVARPNVLMFGDGQWLERRTDQQCQRYERWRSEIEGRRLVTIECGAGKGVPTVRHHSERQPGTLIRINPGEPDIPIGGISIPLGAGEARPDSRRSSASENGGAQRAIECPRRQPGQHGQAAGSQPDLDAFASWGCSKRSPRPASSTSCWAKRV